MLLLFLDEPFRALLRRFGLRASPLT
jgi:hypothetical protein